MKKCDQTVYGPAVDEHCSIVSGPAAVRIGTRRRWRLHVRRFPRSLIHRGDGGALVEQLINGRRSGFPAELACCRAQAARSRSS